MATAQLNGMIQNLRRSAYAHDEGGLTDAQLLDAFLGHADQDAFEAIVRRHSGMVWGVCLRVLGHSHDAEDAFQAVFLVFMRKANTIWPRSMVGNWLHGVAYRTALKAKAAAMKRRAREKPMEDVPAKEDEKTWSDVKPLLDRELNRLADKYRVPVVLCDLEGKSQREAARQLGWPEGTLMTRLARARQILARRLTRHGLALSGGAIALLVAQHAAAAPMPLLTTTLKAAATSTATSASVAALTEGVLQAMFLTKIKTVATVLLSIVFLGVGAGLVTQQVLADRTPAAVVAQPNAFDPIDDFTIFQERGERPAGIPPSLSGRVVAVAQDAKSFTVETAPVNRGDDPVKHEIKLNDQSKVTFSNVGANGAKLAPRMGAQVWLADGSKDTAATVSLMGGESTRRTPDVSGKVTSVSKDGSSISIEVIARGRDAGPTVDVKMNLGTFLTYSGVSKGGAKPTEGYIANVWFERGSKDTASTISYQGEPLTDRTRVAPATDHSGKVVGISKDGKVVTIEIPPANRGDEPSKVEYKINGKTKITYFNIGPDGDRITEGYFARIGLVEGAKDTAAAIALSDTPKERNTILRSKVASVAKDGKSFTIELPPVERGGETKVVNVKITEHTRSAYIGVGPGGAQPTVGYLAEVWLEEGSMTDAMQVILMPETGGRGR